MSVRSLAITSHPVDHCEEPKLPSSSYMLVIELRTACTARFTTCGKHLIHIVININNIK